MQHSSGLTLIELLLALAIGAVLIAALSGVVGQTLQIHAAVSEQNALNQQARFAMARMVRAVSRARRLILPLAENPATAGSESVREYPPRSEYPNETAVLAITLDPTLDRDGDGFFDADNDKDGRIDEDLASDRTNDAKPGIVGIDDDNDGSVDEGSLNDDDEDGSSLEDPFNGVDDDGDGSVDEDNDDDMNQDGLPGIAGYDDDSDTVTDEGNNKDDDEDGLRDEDGLDPVVFYLDGATLWERMPNLNPGDGQDYTPHPIAENIGEFRVERIPAAASDRPVLVAIKLTLIGPGGGTVSLQSQVRVGAGM